MIKSYEEATKYLISAGWRKENAGIFHKNNWELVWDTSHYVEIYVGKERIAEGSIDSREDMVNFINVNNLI